MLKNIRLTSNPARGAIQRRTQTSTNVQPHARFREVTACWLRAAKTNALSTDNHVPSSHMSAPARRAASDAQCFCPRRHRSMKARSPTRLNQSARGAAVSSRVGLRPVRGCTASNRDHCVGRLGYPCSTHWPVRCPQTSELRDGVDEAVDRQSAGQGIGIGYEALRDASGVQ